MSGKISSENGESWGIFRELTARARIHYKPFYLHYAYIEALFEGVIGQLLGVISARSTKYLSTRPLRKRMIAKIIELSDTLLSDGINALIKALSRS